MSFEWTDENVGLLKAWWEEGMTASLIAFKLGTTKNSVVGKRDRLGLEPRENPVKKAVKQKLRRKRQENRQRFQPAALSGDVPGAKKIVKPVHKNDAFPVHMAEAKIHQCRFPMWKDKLEPDYMVCGKQVYDRYPYCKEHYDLCCPKPKKIVNWC